jgi:AraC family transcriptional regulator, chitin signaling transcriptional activator
MSLLYTKLFPLITIFLLVLGLSTAQEVPKVIQFQKSDYSAGHQNWMISQDCNGYIYVANTNGVLIYNGYKWQLVVLPKNEKPRAVFKGKDCRIYTGAFETFGYIDISDRNNPCYKPIADSLLHDSNQEIWNIFGNEKQIIFQSFSNIYDYNYDSIAMIIPPANIMLGKRINDNLYIPKIEQGLYRINTDQVFDVPLASKFPVGTKIADLCGTGQSDEVILGTQYNGVFLLKENELIAFESNLNDRFKNEQINKLIRLSTGEYVVGTILNGIYITDDFLKIKYHISKLNGLSNNTVLSLFEDENKDLWVGLDKGINLIKTSDPLTYFYDKQGKLGTIFTSINYKGALYLGTNQGVFKSNPSGVFSIVENSQGQNWSFIIVDGDLICGHNNGTYQIKNGEFIQISDITGGWCMAAIDSSLILQSTYTGLLLLEKKEGNWSFKRRIEMGDMLLEKFILAGNTLVGYHSYYGVSLIKFSPTFEKVIFKKVFDKIDDIEINKDDVNLITLIQGIILSFDSLYFKINGERFQKISITEIDSFRQDELFDYQYHFYNSINEISKTEELSTYQFFKPEKDRKSFILGIDEGYLLSPVDYEKDKDSSTKVNVDFLVLGDSTFNKFDKLLFSPSQNNIKVQLKDFTFNSQNVALKYNLKNWDGEWRNVPIDGQLNFINLNDGDYELFLRSNKDKPINLLKFSIKPHWYESWLGAILYGIVFILLIWQVDKRNRRKLKLQTQKLQNEKNRELESERIKAKNDKLERDIIYKSKMLANSTLALVQKNKMLNELKEFILKERMEVIIDRQYKQRIINLINRNINHDEDWEIFERNFAAVHEDFLEKLKTKYPDISAGDLKLAAYIRMNLSSKQIAPLLNISVRSVENKRYRLRKKMGIEHDDNLSDLLLRL